jgi:hypothetical protein
VIFRDAIVEDAGHDLRLVERQIAATVLRGLECRALYAGKTSVRIELTKAENSPLALEAGTSQDLA